jgi:hypothetical protein
MHSFELRTSSTLPRCSRVTSNPEVEPQKRDDQNWASGTRGIYELHQVGLYTGIRDIEVLQLKHNIVGVVGGLGLKTRCECHLQRLTLTQSEFAGHLPDGSKALWNSLQLEPKNY